MTTSKKVINKYNNNNYCQRDKHQTSKLLSEYIQTLGQR